MTQFLEAGGYSSDLPGGHGELRPAPVASPWVAAAGTLRTEYGALWTDNVMDGALWTDNRWGSAK